MTKRQRSQYRMFVRVRDFGNTHKAQFPEGSEGSTAFAAVTAAVADIDAFNRQKQTGRRDSTREKLAANVLDDDQVVMNTWKRQRHVDVTGKSASAGEPSADPVPPSEGEPLAPQTAEVPAPVTSASGEPLRRAQVQRDTGSCYSRTGKRLAAGPVARTFVVCTGNPLHSSDGEGRIRRK